ncbi:hypothetical protein J6590_052768 [Homalodisca vitripennis]|nr:hypothetical protein J6590_052768 [Homalodisca vitripennis]
MNEEGGEDTTRRKKKAHVTIVLLQFTHPNQVQKDESSRRSEIVTGELSKAGTLRIGQRLIETELLEL